MIIIEPMGGLGNRMRAIDSAIAYGKQTEEKVYILWIMDKWLNCPFDKLFEKPEGISGIYQLRKEKLISRLFFHALHRGFKFICGNYYLQSDISPIVNKGEDFPIMQKSKCTYINTVSRFYMSPQPFGLFHPIGPLKNVIESYQIDKQYVGIHIRRTDNENSISFSPTTAFIERMEKELIKFPATKFFIASDSLEEKQFLGNKFPGKIVVHEQKNFNRSDTTAIQNAVIDLYLLSKCRKIIGSYWSSFTETAWQLGGIDCEIINVV